jgi:hypothetical protein
MLENSPEQFLVATSTTTRIFWPLAATLSDVILLCCKSETDAGGLPAPARCTVVTAHVLPSMVHQ